MTHQEKVDRLIADLGKQGVSPYTVAPPLFRLLWAVGIPVPPPFFLGFLPLTAIMGVFFGLGWGLAMWLLGKYLSVDYPLFFWRELRAPFLGLFIISAAAGLLFGLSMAGLYGWKASRLNLPRWETYPD